MSGSFHIRPFLIALVVWLAFFVAGLPAYYQQYPTVWMVLFSVTLIPPIWLIAVRVLKSLQPEPRRVAAVWLAFYFTVPLVVLDYLYCGVVLGHGLGFFTRYWYLTLFYIVPWPILIGAASWVSRSTRRVPGT